MSVLWHVWKVVFICITDYHKIQIIWKWSDIRQYNISDNVYALFGFAFFCFVYVISSWDLGK